MIKVTFHKYHCQSNLLQNGTWNGGIRDMLDGLVDIGAAAFTASQIRSTVVDFTIPIVEIVCRFFIKNPKVVLFSNFHLVLSSSSSIISIKTSFDRRPTHLRRTPNNSEAQPGSSSVL